MASEGIGAVRRDFKPAIENTVAGIIIGVLMLGGGVAALGFLVNALVQSRGNLPFWAEKGWSWGALGLLSVLSVALILSGIWLLG